MFIRAAVMIVKKGMLIENLNQSGSDPCVMMINARRLFDAIMTNSAPNEPCRSAGIHE